MMTTTIKRVLGLWIIILLPTLSYAGVPSGHYENHFGPPGTDIWDLSGTYRASGTSSETGAEWDIQFRIAQDDKGKISGQGTATESLDDFEGDHNVTISGSIKSIGDVRRVVLTMKFVGTASDGFEEVQAKGNIKFTSDIDKLGNLLIGTAKGKMCYKGWGCVPFNDPVQINIPEEAKGGAWDLHLDIQNVDGKKLAGTASAILSNERVVPFTLKGSYNANTDLAKLSLKGSGGNFTIQAQAIASQLVFQTITGKMLGQTVNFP